MSQRRRKGTLQPVSMTSQDEQGKRRFMEDFAKACRRMERSDTARAHMYPDSCLEEPFLTRREQAVLNMEEKAQKDFGPLGLSSVFESFARTEIYSWRSLNEIDENGDLGIAASIWILEEIRKAGKMAKLRPILSSVGTVPDFILPIGFSHPSFTESIIEAMYHLLAYRFEETPPEKQDPGKLLTPENFHHKRAKDEWQEILELIPKEDIERAEKMFKDTQWDIETRMMKAQAFYDRKIQKFCQDYGLPLDEDQELDDAAVMALLSPSSQESVSEKIPGSARREIVNTIESAEGLVCFFDAYFYYGREYTRKDTGSAQIAELMSNVRVEDPYAVSFAAYSLLDADDDAPWLLHSAGILLEQTLTMLPWYRNEAEMDEDEFDDFLDGVPFNQGDWLHREPDPKNTDFYHTKCGDRTLAQIIYEYSRGVVPMGPRPFDDRVPELVEKGLDETTAREVTNTAGLLFLPNYQAGMDWEKPLPPDFDDEENPFSDDDFGVADEDLFPVSGYWADVAKAEGVEPPEHLGSDIDTTMEMADEIADLSTQLSNTKRENTSLLAQLAEEKKKTKDLEESTRQELQDLRREHLELADLRELIFRQENQEEQEEVPEGEKVVFPYETKKRTVLFGGFETFRKSLKPLLPDVKFVGVDQMNFDPDLVRNADVVWFQTNCLSHSQYYAVQRLARAAGVQMRYFTYQGARPCAEQLALADAKND